MKASEKQFGVYYQDQSLHDPPSEFISLAEARRLRKENKGYFVNSGQGFRIMAAQCPESDKREQADIHVKARDRSCQMPGSVTEEAVLLEKFSAIQLVRGWAPQYRFA